MGTKRLYYVQGCMHSVPRNEFNQGSNCTRRQKKKVECTAELVNLSPIFELEAKWRAWVLRDLAEGNVLAFY
jgi:hypothetical protein